MRETLMPAKALKYVSFPVQMPGALIPYYRTLPCLLLENLLAETEYVAHSVSSKVPTHYFMDQQKIAPWERVLSEVEEPK